MGEESVMGSKVKGLYKKLCKDEWNSVTAGIIVAFLSVLILVWARPWGAVGAMRNWGEWIIYGLGFWDKLGFWDAAAPKSALLDTGSVIGIGFIAGAFVSANLGDNFDIRIPPVLEMVKGMVAGILMGIGSTLAGGCNVGGMYNAIGNLAANGFAMWLGLVLGVVLGLKYIYWEMEHISWGSGGAKTIEVPVVLRRLLAVAGLAGLIWGAYAYGDKVISVADYNNLGDGEYLGIAGGLSGLLVIAAGIGYTMQRGRWCMVQAFREPHMTGDWTLARGVMVSILMLAVGIAVVKATGLREPVQYVRGTFGIGGVLGGFIFGLGAIVAGGAFLRGDQRSHEPALQTVGADRGHRRGERPAGQMGLYAGYPGLRRLPGGNRAGHVSLVPDRQLERGYRQAHGGDVSLNLMPFGGMGRNRSYSPAFPGDTIFFVLYPAAW
ncbi:MAG: YeeE/YedE thiosulfate transporter family protein [Desulfurivibrionaceae bacterium]